MSAVGDLSNLDENDTSARNVRQSTRPRTLSERGLSYEREKTLKSSRDLARQILKLCEKISHLSSSKNYDGVREAVVNLNEAHDEYERVLSKANELGSTIPQNEAQDVVLAVTTAKLDALKVTSPLDIEKSNGSVERVDEVQSRTDIEIGSNLTVKKVESPIPSEDSSNEKHVKNDKAKDTLPPEQLVQYLDKRLQEQIKLLDQSVLSNNEALVQSELDNLGNLMKDISEEKLQLSLVLDVKENNLLNSWFNQANTDVLNKKTTIKKYLSSVSGNGLELSNSTQSSASILSVIKRDTNTNTNASCHVQETNVSKKQESSHSSSKSEISERSHKTISEKNISKWLENLNDKRSSHSSIRSIKQQRDSKSDKSSNLGSDNRKLAESAKGSMERIHKKLLMQLSLIDSALATNDVELVRSETANLDRVFAELSESSNLYEDVIFDSEKYAHSVWINEVDGNVFKKKQEVCSWLVNHNECASRKSSRSGRSSNSKSSKSSKSSHSKGSKASSSSSSSGKSAMQQKAITAGLQAEVNILKETMAKSIEIEAKKKEDEIKSRIEKIEIQLARSKAMESVYGGSRSLCSDVHKKSNEAVIKASYETSRVKEEVSKPKDKSEFKTTPVNVSESSTKQVTELSKDMVRALKAPSAEIDVFKGDSLEYHYFRSNFREAVEKMIDDQRGRLTRLIKYTDGDAKDLIKHCVHADPHHCYDQAIALLDAEYGSPHKISYAYLQRLQDWPSIKLTDTVSFKRLYRFLLQCRTYKTNGRLQELDSATTLRSVIQKLNVTYQDEWSILAEKCRRSGKEANFDDLIEFVDFHSSRAADPAYSRGAMSGDKERNPVKGFVGKVMAPIENTKPARCQLCKKEHSIEKCKEYLDKDIEGRRKTVLDLKLCFKCLQPTSGKHYSRICPNRMECDVCGKFHPTSFHDYNRDTKDTSDDKPASKIASCSVQQRDTDCTISLCILPVLISHIDNPDNEVLVYAMLDNDCTGCFCTTEVMDQITPNRQREALVTVETINGVSEKETTAVEGLIVRRSSKANKAASSKISLPTTFGFDGLSITKDEVPTPSNLKHWSHLQKLMDQIPEYNDAIPFGLMIGGNCPEALEPLEVVPSENNGPYAFNTRLGWCVVGPLSSSSSPAKRTNVQCHRTRMMEINSSWQTPIMIDTLPNHRFVETAEAKDQLINKRLQEMYSLEFNEINSETQGYSQEDERFMEIMTNKVVKVDGHYQLPLPFRNDNVNLPCNRKQAEKRLDSVKRKMEKSDFYRSEYINNINTLLDQGYARKCDDSSGAALGKMWYLPHHGVYQEIKNKIRMVFDCSASYQGHSLNNELLQGPDLTNQLVGVLLRFRMHNVPIMADIEAMFYQVRVPPEQRSFLRFLWWEGGDTKREPSEYEMCVHIFGAISSPSCANYALRRTAEDNRARYGDAVADTIQRDFYVDDMLKSTDNDDTATSILTGVQDSCSQGGFNLTKVVSNSLKVINSTAIEKRAASLKEFELFKKLPIERALGVMWFVESDSFGFRICIEDQPLTRRGILSSISSIYDPCGLGSPFLLRGRKILQEITADKDGWDDPVPPVHASSWEKWRSQLHRLETITVKRCLKPGNFGTVVNSSLHCFSDASFCGYGQATYLRQVDENGKISVALVMAKSRVSPLKSTTVPRLELTAAVLSSSIGLLVKSELAVQGLTDTYWIDNKVVLGYIHNETRRFRIFVANRTRKIRDNTDKSQWRYISTSDNPGDDASRGLLFDDQDKIERWFNGPEFLHLPESLWPTQDKVDQILETDPELKVKVSVNATTLHSSDPCLLSALEMQISDWHRQKRAIANAKRFIKKCLKQKVPPTMTTTELQQAETIILRMIQEKYLKAELDRVRRGIPAKSSALNKLNPYFDEDNILRVGGRLSNSNAVDVVKHPVILGKQGSQRIIEWYHKSVQHQGRTSTVNELRANGFWVLSVNAQVRKVIRDCIRCRLFRGKLSDQKMADLPLDRMLSEPPFTYCGVDIFGPFHTKEGRKQMKRYGVLFTCLSLRAVHIEVAANIDTDSFILSLRRFLARRGPVRVIRSDNGGNFVGCENEFIQEISKMDDDKIAAFLLSGNCDWISWKKNPPVSSHMGGAWERMIKSIRNVLDSLLKEHHARLDDESLHTLLVEAENIVNSRPLTLENLSDPDSQPLTANHLLTLKTKVVMPPPGVFQKEHVYCRKRWKAVQFMVNEFWERWRKEYLVILQSRQKWLDQKRNFQVGDVVLVKEDKTPRNRWKMGRLTEVVPSKDGLIRSANVCLTPCKTSLHRPVTKLVLLLGVEEQI